LLVNTKTLNLANIVTGGEFLGLKMLWLMLPGDTRFTPMSDADTNDPDFLDTDADPIGTTVFAVGHPVQYDILNFAIARFAQTLPATSKLRLDYFRIPIEFVESDESGSESSESSSEEMDEEPVLGQDLPAIFHDG